MARLHRITVTALKDVNLVTARKKLRYRKVDGLQGTGLPEGQDEIYENEHAISMSVDQAVELDVKEDQLSSFADAVERRDIECMGLTEAYAAIAAERAMVEAQQAQLAERKPAKVASK